MKVGCLNSITDVNAHVKAADCVVIVTNHSQYDFPQILEDSKLIVDTRNALGLKSKNNPKVVRL